jgi:hypothetical protein
MSLRLHERLHEGGYAFPNNIAFAVKLPTVNRSARMPRGMSALLLICGFGRARLFLRRKSGANTTTAR